jgi:hypothetical protein
MRELEFHPLAAKYPLMPDAVLSEFAANMQDGYDDAFPIWLYEGKIIDGRNRYLAAQATGMEPTFMEYEGDDPAGFVETANFHRRHLTEEWLMQHRLERVQRVAEARQEGQSLRTIAENEKVSLAQVREDVEDAAVHLGCTAEPKEGTVTGKDGKKHPARKPRKKKTEIPATQEDATETHPTDYLNDRTTDESVVKSTPLSEALEGLANMDLAPIIPPDDGCESVRIPREKAEHLRQRFPNEGLSYALERVVDAYLAPVPEGQVTFNLGPKRLIDLKRKAQTDDLQAAVTRAFDAYLEEKPAPSFAVPPMTPATPPMMPVPDGPDKDGWYRILDGRGRLLFACKDCKRRGGIRRDCTPCLKKNKMD